MFCKCLIKIWVSLLIFQEKNSWKNYIIVKSFIPIFILMLIYIKSKNFAVISFRFINNGLVHATFSVIFILFSYTFFFEVEILRKISSAPMKNISLKKM